MKTIVQLALSAVLLLVMASFVASLLGFGPTSRAAAEVAGVDVEKAQSLIEQSQAEGYITSFTCIGNEAEVTPHFWTGLNARQKKGLALALAAVCNSQQSGDRITILDNHSGKTLASLSGGSYRVE